MTTLAKARAKNKAAFCLATGVQPSEYDRMTVIEHNAFLERHKANVAEINRKMKH